MNRLARALFALLLALPLVSFAPAPALPARQTSNCLPAQQPYDVLVSSYKIEDLRAAYAYQTTVIYDGRNYPYGRVEAWSCAGNPLEAAREFVARTDAMQSEALAKFPAP